MAIFLGLGSNVGDRRAELGAAIAALERSGVAIVRVSPIVESPALLPPGAPPEWNLPFLNLVLECRPDVGREELLKRIKAIEKERGRAGSDRWAPRPIDIDILIWNDEYRSDAALTVPHAGIAVRNFVLAPLLALEPSLVIPDGAGKTVLEHVRALRNHIPLWMGIVNLTPDSFSDGGALAAWGSIEAHLDRMWEAGAQIIDLGAESTRPGATPLTAAEELERLVPVLERVIAKFRPQRLRPLISIDTYHAETAKRALEAGADIINDVGGLTAPAMIELAATHAADWVAMHSLTLPADPRRTLPADADVGATLERWLEERLTAWTRAGLELDRILFDPGIGFGKNPLQSLALLRDIRRFHKYGLRCLVGHSRKSFMQSFGSRDENERDLATVGASLRLCQQGVDVLRVHDVALHAAAYRGWAHVTEPRG
ncbi:MAG TPA: dihydropteroate synthase [Gammaproteobacteria bacterium]|jgi:dihydropteroate synthase/2-amino-4-hydroxy-6-hydroxymethyldihydropteridine diphosphokinase